MNDLRVASHVVGVVTYHYCPVCLKQFLNREDAVLCLEHCQERVMTLLPSEASRLALFAAYTAENEERSRAVFDLDRGVENVSGENSGSGIYLSQENVLQDGISDKEMNDLVPLLKAGAGASELDFVVDDGPTTPQVDAPVSRGKAETVVSKAPEKQDVVSEEKTATPVENSPAVDEEAQPQEIRVKWKPGLKPFRRQGAHYVCNGCTAKYFSRVEAEKCFSSHPMDMPNDSADS
jgi:hypothetical protein